MASGTAPGADAFVPPPAPPEALLERRRASQGRELVSGLLLAIALLTAFALAGHRLYHVASGPTPPGPGTVAPSFAAPDLEGRSLKLEDLKGQVVLVDFWATWCPPCVASVPGLDRLHARHHDRGFTVVGVNQEPNAPEAVRRFVASNEVGFPVVFDESGISARYGVHSLPTSFLIDREGVIRGSFRGIVSESKLEDRIESLLARGR